MDNNNTDQLSDNNILINCVDGSVMVSASAGGQNGNIEVFEPEELVVSTLEDENDGDFNDGDLSLREAIALANEQEGADTITFDSSLNGSIILTEGELNLEDSLTINGLGAANLTIDGNNSSRVFQIDDGNAETDIDVTIDGVTIANGFVNDPASEPETENLGGGILNQENLTITRSKITNNSTGGSFNSNGGGIYTSGTLNLRDSAVTENTAVSGGGIHSISGIVNLTNSNISGNSVGFVGGGLFHQDTEISVTNSTIANNEAARSSGGIFLSNSTGNISNSTITNNSASVDGAGIGSSNTEGGIVNLESTIVAGNANNEDLAGVQINSNGNNLIGNGDGIGSFDSLQGDLVGTADNPLDPKLGELEDNGGATLTIALREGSPAIDAGSNPSNLTFDQRGLGFSRTIGNATDIGAFEVQNNGDGQMNEELVVSTLEDENDGDFSEGDLSLREAIALADNNQTISFDTSLSGGSIVLSRGEFLIDKSLTINGLGARNLTIDGNRESRIFQVDDGIADNLAAVSITGLTIKNGRTGSGTQPEINGGGFLNRETLTITDSALVGNAAGNGGAIYTTGNLQFENSLIDQTGDGTGPIYNDGGIALIVNSTFTNNNVPGVSAIVNNNGGELELANSTITNNRGFGAAVSNSDDSTATVVSTIIASNFAEQPDQEGKDDILGNYISNGNNLIGTTKGGSGFDRETDLVGTEDNPIDPGLGTLQDNGGLTQTIALLEDSPAIDAGSNPNNLITDQRGEGFDRTIGNSTDIGAFEVQTISNEDILGTEGRDFLQGTSENDRIFGLDGTDFIQGLSGDDLIDGGSGGDRLLGGAGNDTITDGAGNDIVFGDEGDDILIASNAGDDLFQGGAGNDTYVYDLNSDAGGFERTRIIDFEPEQDLIAFRPLVSDLATLDQFADLDTNGSGVLDSGDERIQIRGISTVIDFSDLFGRSQNSDTITLVAATNLNESNFLFNETVVGTELG